MLHHNQENNRQQIDFEAMLDRTLRARSQAGPRAGFHSRLAESLRQASVPQGLPSGWWNWLSASLSAAALAGVVAGSFAVLHRYRASAPQQSSVRVRHNVDLAVAVPTPSVEVATLASTPAEQARRLRSSRSTSAASPSRQLSESVLARGLPRLETFPSPASVSGHPFGSGDPVVAISPQAARAMLGLQQQQAQPITLTALNENRPLFGENQ